MTKSNFLALFAWLDNKSQAFLFGWLIQPSGTSHRPEGIERLNNVFQARPHLHLRQVQVSGRSTIQPPVAGRLFF
jgi:hypothetical protein